MRKDTHILELTSFCNLHCPFCLVNHGMKRPHRHMTLEETSGLLREIASIGPDQEVYLFNYGEPLLHPEIVRIVQLATSLGLRTKISTNGIHLSQLGPQLVSAGLTVLMIDLDGITHRAHSTYRVGSDVIALKAEIREFMDAIKTRSAVTQIMIQTLVHNVNLPEMGAIREFANSVGIQFIAWKSLALDLGVSLGEQARLAAYSQLIPQGTQFDRYAGLIRDNGNYCIFGDMNGVVLSNGDYTVCTHDAQGEVVLGNVFKTSYLELRESAFELARDQIRSRNLIPCSRCSMSTHLGHVEDLARGQAVKQAVNFTNDGILIPEK